MATLGGMEIHVVSESLSYSVGVPEKPVEQGLSLSDHIEKNPITMKITGKLLGPHAAETREKLLSNMNGGVAMTYLGRNAFFNALLVSFDPDTDAAISNGMRFSAELREIRVSASPYETVAATLAAEVKPVTDNGTQQTVNPPSERFHTIRRGESLYSIAPKYGTTWRAIQALNPSIDPTRLQIGQEVRVS